MLFEGRDVWQTRGAEFGRYRRAVQIVHQDPYASLNPTRTVYQTLSAPLERHRMVGRGAESVRRVRELLRLVDLTPPDDYLGKYPHQLSGGQRQRVVDRARADGRAALHRRRRSGLDGRRLDPHQPAQRAASGCATIWACRVVFITHDLAVASYFARERAASA